MSVPQGPPQPNYSPNPHGYGQGSYPPAGPDPYGQHAMQPVGQYQQTTSYQPGPSDFTPAPKQTPWLIPAVAVVTFVVGAGIGLLTKGDPPIPDPTPVPPVTATVTSQPPPVTVTVTATVEG